MGQSTAVIRPSVRVRCLENVDLLGSLDCVCVVRGRPGKATSTDHPPAAFNAQESRGRCLHVVPTPRGGRHDHAPPVSSRLRSPASSACIVKRFSKKMLGEVPEPIGVYWHNRPVLKAFLAVGGKVQKWDACDET